VLHPPVESKLHCCRWLKNPEWQDRGEHDNRQSGRRSRFVFRIADKSIVNTESGSGSARCGFFKTSYVLQRSLTSSYGTL
jgi:hypothetical protein